VLSVEQKATRVQMSRKLYNNLIFERQKKIATIITGERELVLLVLCGIGDVGTITR
jgi:predicted DNA-binding protein (UPF0251 family)